MKIRLLILMLLPILVFSQTDEEYNEQNFNEQEYLDQGYEDTENQADGEQAPVQESITEQQIADEEYNEQNFNDQVYENPEYEEQDNQNVFENNLTGIPAPPSINNMPSLDTLSSIITPSNTLEDIKNQFEDQEPYDGTNKNPLPNELLCSHGHVDEHRL